MSSYSLKDIKNTGELSDEIKPPSKSAEYVHNELLLKMNPTTLTKNNLWDAEEQDKWTMDEGDLWYNEQIRLGNTTEDGHKPMTSGHGVVITKETKEEVKQKAVQLSLFL